MQIARRICLPWWSFLLICAAAMAITALVVYEATTEPEPEAPVSYSFQPETGALTFYIPEGDLAPGRTITLSDDQMPGCESFLLSTDDVRHFESGEAMAQAMDPEGYDQALLAYEEADPETADLVKSLINGYYWSCYVNMTAYELEFWAEDNFEVRSSLGTSATGTYTVRNGYIFCTYPDTGYTVEVPYELVDGEIDLDMIAAFDVKG